MDNVLDKVMIPSYKILKSIEKHDKTAVKYFLQQLDSTYPEITKDFFESIYIFARGTYEVEDFDSSLKFFLRIVARNPYDEFAQFYLGCIYLKLRQFTNAKTCFQNMLFINSSSAEAKNNLSITIKSQLQGFIKEVDWNRIAWNISTEINIDVENLDECFNLPIFINNRDRVNCLQKLITWLLNAGYRNIFVLDQQSTYQPLLEFYETFRKDSRVHILRMQENFGFQCVWNSFILEDLNITTPYVYTDSDVLPYNCSANFVQELLRTLKNQPMIQKVGARLIYEDITFQNKELMQKIHQGYYQDSRLVSSNEYFSPVDTTFAVYRNVRHYSCLYSIVRKDIKFLHLPWYYDLDNLPPDEIYYMQHSNHSSTLSSQFINS